MSNEQKNKISETNIITKRHHYTLKNDIKEYHLNSTTLKEFCNIHQIYWDAIMKTKKSGIPYKGWILIEITK